ncbi:MAG TPA: T9SS type A sorting domain-containing protein [Paludibacter sp.]|nr:T9SS type A sorting domain-containing protein [Paludibacter sp.]
MKKTNYLKLMLALLVAMLLGTANMQAASYQLAICGVQVTDANKDNLKVISGVSGTAVTYNPGTKTLTLNNATISTSSNGIVSYIDGLTIELIGDNTITITTTDNIDGIQLQQNPATIQGSGTLTINAPNKAIFVNYATLTIKNCTVNATGISGFYGYGASLVINKATVTATGTNGSIHGFTGGISLINCSITSPADAIISNGSVLDAGGNLIKGTVKIGIAKYNLWICGGQVTDLNKDNLSVVSGTNGCTVSGSVTYNSDNKTLMLNNANITIPNGANAIKSGIEGLNIDVQGDNNSVNSDGWATIRFEKSAAIKGGGKLNVSHSAGQGWAIYAYGSSVLTIDGCTVNATSTGRSITGDDGGTLTINNATVTLTGPNGSITHFADINLNDCEISEPAGAVVSKGADNFYAVRDTSGNIIVGTVKIVPATPYKLWVCEVQVNSFNKNNIAAAVGSANGTVTGNVSYDPVSNTLTLDNATITAVADKWGVNFWIENLTIELKGNNTITTTNKLGVIADNNFTIQGSSGSDILNISTNTSGLVVAALEPFYCQLTIRNCTLNAVGSNGCYGILGYNSILTIENSTVSATGPKGSISEIKQLDLIGCAITQPADAEYNATQKAVCYKNTDNIVKETVKIEPTGAGTGIDKINANALTLYPNPVQDILHIQADEAVTAVRIYNVNGTAVAQATGENISEISLAHLPAGIYMVRVEAGEMVRMERVVKR